MPNDRAGFKPGQYTRKMIFQSMTQAARRKSRLLPTGVEVMTFWLLAHLSPSDWASTWRTDTNRNRTSVGFWGSDHLLLP